MAHPKISKLSSNVVACGVLFSLFLFSLGSAYLLRPSIRARYLLNAAETLRVGKASFSDAQQLASKIGANPTPFGPCSPSDCEWDVRVGNSKLPIWWRGKGATFAVSFDVKDSIVVRKSMAYAIGTETDVVYPSSVGIVQQENWGRRRVPEPLAAGWQTSDWYKYWQFKVYITPKATAEQWRRYTSYNFSCFWKYKGCKDGRDLLPVSRTYPAIQPQ